MIKACQLWIGVSLLASNACGPAYPIQEKQNTQPLPEPMVTATHGPAIDLEFKIATRPKLDDKTQSVDFEENPGLDFEMRRTGYEISLSKSLTKCAQMSRLFFSWSEKLNDKKIISSSISYQYLNSNNHWSPEYPIGTAQHDVESNRWFISLSQLISSRLEKESLKPAESETQVMIMDLLLTDFTAIRLQVKFRVSGNILK